MEPVTTDGAPYGILNFDVLWWVVILAFLTVVAGFYITTYVLTRPLKGDPDSIFYRSPSLYRRAAFLSEVNKVERKFSSGELHPDAASETLNDIIIRFLQTKTKTDITGYTYAELKLGGAPEDLLEAVSQSYHILYTPINGAEKRYRVNELIKVSKKVVMRWR